MSVDQEPVFFQRGRLDVGVFQAAGCFEVCAPVQRFVGHGKSLAKIAENGLIAEKKQALVALRLQEILGCSSQIFGVEAQKIGVHLQLRLAVEVEEIVNHLVTIDRVYIDVLIAQNGLRQRMDVEVGSKSDKEMIAELIECFAQELIHIAGRKLALLAHVQQFIGELSYLPFKGFPKLRVVKALEIVAHPGGILFGNCLLLQQPEKGIGDGLFVGRGRYRIALRVEQYLLSALVAKPCLLRQFRTTICTVVHPYKLNPWPRCF